MTVYYIIPLVFQGSVSLGKGFLQVFSISNLILFTRLKYLKKIFIKNVYVKKNDFLCLCYF